MRLSVITFNCNIRSLPTSLSTPIQRLINANIQSASHMATTQCIYICSLGENYLLRFKLSIGMSKNGNFTLNMEHQVPAIQDQETGATICTGLPKLDNRLDKNCLVS